MLRAGPAARGRADRLGFEVANDVVLNQALVSFGDDARHDRVTGNRRSCSGLGR